MIDLLENSSRQMREYSDPAKTLELLGALERAGFTDAAFAAIHHHKEPQSIEAHRSYCSMLAEDGDQFRTTNNQLVQRRLEMILAMYRSAGCSTGREAVFIALAKAALVEIPHDQRTLAEQYRDPNTIPRGSA